MAKNTIVIGSRESALAVRQAEIVRDLIQGAHPEIQTKMRTYKTTGDKILDRKLDTIGGKGLFVKELDIALLDGRIDLAVHSLKDMPMQSNPKLPILAYTKREDAYDAFVVAKGKEFPLDGVIGCSSARRTIQLSQTYPEATVKSVRGNIITRLEKLDSGEYDALVLAAAGLRRMNLEHRISHLFTKQEMIPAAGQGILSVQCRKGEYMHIKNCINDSAAEYAARAERSFVGTLDGGCSAPIAAYAIVEGDVLRLTGLYVDERQNSQYVGEISGNKELAEKLGRELAMQLKEESI